MYVHREEGGLLSLLNGGRGMVNGGVGLNCLDRCSSLTLTVSLGIGAGRTLIECWCIVCDDIYHNVYVCV